MKKEIPSHNLNETNAMFEAPCSSDHPIGILHASIPRKLFHLLAGIGSLLAFGNLQGALTDQTASAREIINWSPGLMRADPILDLFYVVDRTNNRIAVIDGTSGDISFSPPFSTSMAGSGIEFSIDGRTLFVSLPESQEIHVLECRTLNPIRTISTDVPVRNFIIGFDDSIYAPGQYELHQLSSSDGTLIRSTSHDTDPYKPISRSPVGHQAFVKHPLSLSFRRAPILISVPESIYWPDEFVFDESTQTVFQLGKDEGFHKTQGVKLNLRTGERIPISIGSLTNKSPLNTCSGLALSPNSRHLYSLAGSPEDGMIRKIRMENGLPEREWSVAHPPQGFHPEFRFGELQITSSGNLLYHVSGNPDELGLLRPSISLGRLPTIVDATASSGIFPNGVELKWGKIPGATQYVISRAGSYDGLTNSVELATTTSEVYFDTSIVEGETYDYWVKAISGSESGEYPVQPVAGFSRGIAPTSSAAPSATRGVHSDRIRVTWSYHWYVESYQLWRAEVYDFNHATMIAETEQLWWDDRDVLPGRTYYYWLKTVNPSGTGPRSSNAGDGHLKTTPPSAPSAISASDGVFEDGIEVIWRRGDQELLYELVRSNDENQENAVVIATNLMQSRYVDEQVVDGQRYFYWIRSMNQAGISNLGSPDGGFTKSSILIAPYGLSASDGEFDDRIELSGYEVPLAISYTVHRAITNDYASSVVVAENITTPIWTDLSAIAPTLYHYWVTANGTLGQKATSQSDSGFQMEIAPDSPSNVRATTGIFDDRIRVFWNPGVRASSYDIYRSSGLNFSSAQKVASGVIETRWDDFSPPPFRIARFYWVVSRNSRGVSGPAGYAGGWTDEQPPVPPSLITASDGTDWDRIQLSWPSVPNALSYRVYRNAVPDFSSAAVLFENVYGNVQSDYAVTRNNTYFYWVTGIGAKGEGSPSPADDGHAREISLGIPSDLAATDGGFADRIALSWTAAFDAKSYQIYRSTVQDGAFALIGTSPTSTYVDQQVSPGFRYYYQVRSVATPLVVSQPGDMDSGFVSIPRPNLLVATRGRYQGAVMLIWQTVDGALEYRIFRGIRSDGADSTLIGETSALEFLDATGTPGSEYFYFIQVQAGPSTSPLSAGRAGYGSINPPFRADGMIGANVTQLMGNDIYEGVQVLPITLKVPKRFYYHVEFSNDGDTVDDLSVKTPSASSDLMIIVRARDGTNVTAAAKLGVFSRKLDSGESSGLMIEVNPSKRLKQKITRSLQLTKVSSLYPEGGSDLVGARVSIKSPTRR